jgi:hypothetical protein
LKAARSAACAVLQDLFAAAVFATAFLTAVEVHFRRNLYTVRSDVPLGLPIQRDIDIASLLALLPSQDDSNENRSPRAASPAEGWSSGR